MIRLLRALLSVLLFSLAAPTVAQTAKAGAPKLVVVVSVDQFSADLMATYRGRFRAGFRTLLDGGVVYASGFQSHAATETCPGHATLLTGRHPAGTGIVANRWIDAATGAEVYCTDSPGYTVQGSKLISGPANLMATTLGDWLKDRSARNRVYAVAGKDRAAIMMAGHKPDGVYWFNDGDFQFTTYVAPGGGPDHAARMAPLARLNAALAASWKKAPPTWQLLDKNCQARGGSVTAGEISWTSKAPPEGWPLTDGLKSRLLRASPVWDDVVADAAIDLLATQKLGRGDGTDVLAIGFSATDYVGHAYGAQGAEMCDQLAHLDVTLGRLLAAINSQKVPFVLVLSADHGGLDVVERLRANGYADAGRPSPWAASELFDGLNSEIRQQFGLSGDAFTAVNATVGAPDLDQLTLLPTVPAAQRADILRAAQRWLKKSSQVADVFVSSELAAQLPPAGAPPTEWSMAARVAVNVYAGRGGDLYVVFPPNHAAPAVAGYTAGHGSPYDYDRRVPILFYGTGIGAHERPLPIDTVDIAPTLAHVLGVTPPVPVDGRCLTLGDDPAGGCK